MKPITNPIERVQTLRNQGIDITESTLLRDVPTKQLQGAISELVKKRVAEENKKAASCWDEGKPQDSMIRDFTCGVGEVCA